MDNHDCEKGGVEPGEGRVEAGDEAPGECKVEIASVVDLEKREALVV